MHMAVALRCSGRNTLFLLFLLIFFAKSSVKGVSERRKCTYESLLIGNAASEKLLANLFSPLVADVFFREAFESQPLIVQNRNPGFYSSLVDLNVIGQYLENQDFEGRRLHQQTDEVRSSAKIDGRAIKHGVDWKLVKRVWRNGDWWCSSPNISMIPLNIVRDSFQRKGFSIVINKMQEFHYPLKVVTSVMENIFGCPVNANVYVTPHGSNQAFESHFDWMDGIIVQVMGCKTWIVNSTPTAVRPMPDTVFKIHDSNATGAIKRHIMSREKGWESSDVKFLGDDSYFISHSSPREFDMKEGSLLYIPRGFTHQAATNCSKQAKDSAENSQPDSDISNVASIHVTFGLEAVTDSTVEIFLHHYISSYFKDQVEKCDEYAADNTVHRPQQQDQSGGSAARCRAGLTSGHETAASSTLSIFLRSHRGNALRVELLSACDLAHLILHSAATSDSRKGTASRAAAEQHDYIVSDDGTRARGEEGVYQSSSSILRQAVATTTFMARNRYQPMVADLLPGAMEYLTLYLTEHTANEVIHNAILLAMDMNTLRAKRDNSGHRSNGEASSIDSKLGDDKGPESSTNLNYIKRFMTSDPVISLVPTAPGVQTMADSGDEGQGEAEGDGVGRGSGGGEAERKGVRDGVGGGQGETEEIEKGRGGGADRQRGKDIKDLRLLLMSEEWSITLDSHDSATSAKDFFLTVFRGLIKPSEDDLINPESGRYSNTNTDLFCSSWRRMMDTLKAQIANGAGP